jgi:GNAT superfamily N-acetyltransferase
MERPAASVFLPMPGAENRCILCSEEISDRRRRNSMAQAPSVPLKISYLGDNQEMISIVASWIYKEWSFLYAGRGRRYVENFLRERLHKRKLPLTLVAFAGDLPVGTVSLKEHDMEERPDLPHWVTSLYVVSRWRRKGIGSSLMHAAEHKATALGIGRLFLFTADPQLAAGFYQGLGWNRKETAVCQSYPVIIMEKALEAKNGRKKA